MFHKKKQEMACKNSLLKNIEELKEKAIQWDRLAEAAEELSNENQFLKEEQEKLRIKLWHQGYEYDRLISDLELNQIEKELPGNRNKLESFKDKYISQICFMIGNGPSLKAEDLELIKKFPCFGCNKINQIYKQTSWRPEFYFCTDEVAYANQVTELSLESNTVFLPIDFFKNFTSGYESNIIFYPLFRRYCLVPEFSNNPLRGVYDAGTVLYIAAQFAVYMGFKEIVLLGVDAQWNMLELPDGRKIMDMSGDNVHFYNDDEDMTEKFAWMNFNDLLHSGIYDIQDGWRMLNYQIENLEIKVTNATRGGSLEVFPREALEDVLMRIG